MEITLFSNIKKLYDNELYSNVTALGTIIHTVYDHDRSLLTAEQEFMLLMFEANSYYHERRFRIAEQYFRQATIAREVLYKQKQIGSIENTYEHFSIPETAYRLAICLKEMQQNKDAISVLQSIPNKSRTPKINLLLGKLQQYEGNTNGASMSYKDLLRECPLALEGIRNLLQMGVTGIEVNSIIINASFTPQCSDWLNFWIKGHDLMYNKKFIEAIDSFNTINETSKIRNNEFLLVLIGNCYYYNGKYDCALRYLEQAHLNKPYSSEGLMELAVLYSKKNKLKELEKLTMPTLSITEYTSENWFVLGQFLYTGQKYEKAAYFAQKAIFTNPRNIEAYLLKVKIFMELKKYREAMTYLRSAQNIAPYRYEIYRFLVNCYMATYRERDAQRLAAHTAKDFGSTPRCLVLVALTLFKDPRFRKKTFILLEKALEIDEYHLPAVLMMVEYLQSEGDIQGVKNLLKKQLEKRPYSRLHAMLGDLLSAEKDMEGALENYTIALNLDPTNARALTGLNALGHSSRTNLGQDGNYIASNVDEESPIECNEHPFEMAKMPSTGTGDTESDNEALWFDVEVEVNHN